ncbi:MAG: hypothetical protein K5629_01295 [Eubacteriales bacterium]|nr:hypothetical protein [Eubacteriales bacterium]
MTTWFLTINETRKGENPDWVEGLDVLNVGLRTVLYDVNQHVYYTPNTDTVDSIDENSEAEMLEGYALK